MVQIQISIQILSQKVDFVWKQKFLGLDKLGSQASIHLNLD